MVSKHGKQEAHKNDGKPEHNMNKIVIRNSHEGSGLVPPPT